MHFLCSTFGSAGDVFPLLGLALELRRRGHDVTLATNDHFGDAVRSQGVPFEPLGTVEDYQATIRNPDLWHPQRAFPHIFRSLQPALERQYQIYAEHASDGTVIGITNCFGFGALLAQDKFGLPVVTLHCQPAVLWSDREPPLLPGTFGPRWLRSILFRVGERFFMDPVVCPFLNEWRSRLGLPPVRKITRWWNSRTGVLCLFPEWYAPPQPDWPSGLMQTDFPLWNLPHGEGLADDVERFLSGGEPPLVFTPGSANLHGRPFFAAAVEACRILGRRGILLTAYPDQLPSPLPESVAHFAYIPLDILLPRAAAFIHHGGIGSTSQAMLAGIPQVLMPLAHDQFDNAERIRRLGIGDSLAVRQFTGTRLSRRLAALLTSQPVAGRCRAVAERLARRDGLQRSAVVLEQLAAVGNRPARSVSM